MKLLTYHRTDWLHFKSFISISANEVKYKTIISHLEMLLEKDLLGHIKDQTRPEYPIAAKDCFYRFLMIIHNTFRLGWIDVIMIKLRSVIYRLTDWPRPAISRVAFATKILNWLGITVQKTVRHEPLNILSVRNQNTVQYAGFTC